MLTLIFFCIVIPCFFLICAITATVIFLSRDISAYIQAKTEWLYLMTELIRKEKLNDTD